MNTKTRKWTAAGLVLGLALGGVTAGLVRGDDDDDAKALKKAMEAASKEVMKNLNKPGTPGFDTAAAKLATQHKIEPTMNLMKLKKKGGIGIGGLQSLHKDSIDLLIIDYATGKPPTKAEVDKYADDLVKVARVTAVIAEMTPYWGPTKPQGMKTPAKWKELTSEMKKGSADLIAAATAKDEKAIVAAARSLKNSCAECHRIFRDDK